MQTNYKRDARQNHTPEPSGRDNCQSPPYAILPLLPYLKKDWLIWEPAVGEGYLADSMEEQGFYVVSSGLSSGHDFFSHETPTFDALVTNPPHSRSRDWLERCYQLGKPFALLMKTEIISNRGIQELCRYYGDLEHIFTESRISFKMPNKGWAGAGAQFNTHWFTWGLEVGRSFVYLSPILEEKREFHNKMAARMEKE